MEGKFPQEHLLRLDAGELRPVILSCTDEALPELIAGYLRSQGRIGSCQDIVSLELSPDHAQARAVLRNPSAGGGEAVPGAEEALPEQPLRRRYGLDAVVRCAEKMERYGVRRRETGGTHCAALFEGERLLAVFEDISRRNTLDKLSGALLLRGETAEDALLVTTGRVNYSLLKIAACTLGASVIASYSAPTALAAEAAERANLTLIAYLKTRRQICTAAARIL